MCDRKKRKIGKIPATLSVLCVEKAKNQLQIQGAFCEVYRQQTELENHKAKKITLTQLHSHSLNY